MERFVAKVNHEMPAAMKTLLTDDDRDGVVEILANITLAFLLKDKKEVQVPIYSSTTFKYDTTQHMADLFDLKAAGYFYTRLANPTNDLVAKKIAALEGGIAAILTSSGQAASTFRISGLLNEHNPRPISSRAGILTDQVQGGRTHPGPGGTSSRR